MILLFSHVYIHNIGSNRKEQYFLRNQVCVYGSLTLGHVAEIRLSIFNGQLSFIFPYIILTQTVVHYLKHQAAIVKVMRGYLS